MWLIVRQLLITCLTLHTFLFWFRQTIAFSPVLKCLSLYISEFTHVSICFTPMFHLFAIPPSQCAPANSAERSTNAILVACPAHNLLITWLASLHRRFYSIFHILLHFYQFFNVLVCTCLSLYLSSQAYSYLFINLQSFRHNVPPHGLAEQSTSTVLVTWLAHNFRIASPVSPHKAQQGYYPHSAIDPILPSTLSPSKTPGTSFSFAILSDPEVITNHSQGLRLPHSASITSCSPSLHWASTPISKTHYNLSF